MNKSPLRPLLLLLCLIAASAASSFASTIQSTYIGPIGGNWSDPANWSPHIVPNNSATQKFHVSVAAEFPGVTLDIDVMLKSLSLTGEGSTVFLLDHSLASAASSVAVNFPNELFGGGIVFAQAQSTDVVANLGDLADFSGTTLRTGNYVLYVPQASTGLHATLKFNGADIQRNEADIQLAGTGTRIVDQNGNDALRHFNYNKGPSSIFDIETGRKFTTGGSLVNEGELHVIAGFGGDDADTTLTIDGDYTDIGFPLDAGTNGINIVLAPGPIGNARMIINGRLTNYDPATQTLHKSYWFWQAARGRDAITKVLGGSTPLNIVTSHAAMIMFGPNTGFRDEFGNDALRNLAVSSRLLIGDRDFDTAGSFTSTSRLSIFGDTKFEVHGNLTIRNGFFEITPLTGYARQQEDSFPNTPAYVSSRVIVRGNFNLPSASILRFHVLNQNITATMDVKGAAVLAGSLQVAVEDLARVDATASYTVMTAGEITGQFSNVANGQRVKVFAAFDQFGTPLGRPVGTFRVTYDKTSLVLSDFRAK